MTSSCTCAYLTVKNYEKLDKPLDMVWCNLISFTRDFCYREISTHLFFKGRRDALLDVGSQPLLTFIVYLLISSLTKKYVKERTSIRSPGPMSKIRSDLRVRTRGFTNVTCDSSYASDSYFTNKPSGSDSKFRSDFRHWTRATNHRVGV